MRHLLILAALVVTACGGAGTKGANSADEEGGDGDGDAAGQSSAKSGGTLEAGTTVCINELVGVRYQLEEALEAAELAPEDSCMTADVQMEEKGGPNDWTMRYQRVGDADWKECKSSQEARDAFANECISQMVSDLGGS
jgi:hypothetical protein